MADSEKIAFEVDVKGSEQTIESMKDLKAAIKAAKDEQLKAASVYGESSKEFIEASKNVSKLKDKVEDLNDSTKSLKGSGVERASEGFNQLGEGLRNLDFDKVKVGLVAMKSALAAVGIGLIVQAVTYLVENFDELSKGSGLLAKALRFVGDIITSVKDIIFEFTDAIGLTNTALDKLGDSTVENANKAKEALAAQTAEYDRQIAIAKASGKSAVDLEIAKQQAIIDTNKALVEQTIAYVREGGQLNEGKKKLLTEQLEAIRNAKNQQEIIEVTAEKSKNEKLLAEQKSYNLKKKAEDDIYKKEAEDWFQRELQFIRDEQAAKDAARFAEEQAQLDLEQRQKEQDEAMYEGMAQRNKKALDDKKAQDDAARAADEEAKKWDAEKTLQAAQTLNDSLKSLSDSYFYFKNKNLEKGSAAELEQAKKQFKINKALAITSTIISGIQGVVNTLSAPSVIPEPFGTILKAVSAASIGIAAAANVAKISSTQFNPGGGGGSSSGGAVAVPIPTPPTINTPNANTNSSTSFDETGKKVGEAEKQGQPTINVKATVGVDEITDKSNRVQVLEKQSTF